MSAVDPSNLSEERLRDSCLAEPMPEEPDCLRQIVLLPTGYGKSLCFQLPAILLSGVTLVVFPLRSLMADQERRMRERGLSCAILRGGMEQTERDAMFDDVRSGKARLVLANPEILRTEVVLSFLRSIGIVHAVIDEAHCVAEWGEDFGPAYQDLGDIIRSLRPQAMTAFTATASPRILEKTSEVLFGEEPYRVIAGNSDRPNIHYSCVSTLSKNHTLERLVRELPKPLLVFCASRAGTEIIAETLMERLSTQDIRFYHAGMSKPERSGVESWFIQSSHGILTATCAFGMGIDKSNIRTIIHADPPPSVESYLQESGRAGRDGNPSLAVLISHPDDFVRIARLKDPLRRDRFKAILTYARNASRCRREQLLGLLGSSTDYCAGCDVCEGTADSEPEGRDEILKFASANSGRFQSSDVPRRLAGLAGPCAFSGTLAGWDTQDIRETLRILVKNGDITLASQGLWKNRIRKTFKNHFDATHP